MKFEDALKKYAEEEVKRIEEEIASEELTEEEKEAERKWQEEFCDRMMKLIREKYSEHEN